MPIEEALSCRSVVIVAAHPDDETVGAGSLLPRLQRPIIVTVTDGAPRNSDDAQRAGCATREEYAALRQRELLDALDVAGIRSDDTRSLGIVDQEASLEMAYLTLKLLDVLREFRPAYLLTHPYEGGHPDHDATAFAVHAACARVPSPPTVFEFTSYHAAEPHCDDTATMETGRFLGDRGETIVLSRQASRRKSQMIECYGPCSTCSATSPSTRSAIAKLPPTISPRPRTLANCSTNPLVGASTDHVGAFWQKRRYER